MTLSSFLSLCSVVASILAEMDLSSSSGEDGSGLEIYGRRCTDNKKGKREAFKVEKKCINYYFGQDIFSP